jgi:hypothetical protein
MVEVSLTNGLYPIVHDLSAEDDAEEQVSGMGQFQDVVKFQDVYVLTRQVSLFRGPQMMPRVERVSLFSQYICMFSDAVFFRFFVATRAPFGNAFIAFREYGTVSK